MAAHQDGAQQLECPVRVRIRQEIGSKTATVSARPKTSPAAGVLAGACNHQRGRGGLDSLSWFALLGLLGWLLIGPLPAEAQAGATPPTVLRVGILAFGGKAQAQQQWAPTLRLLEASLPGHALEGVPLDYDEFGAALQRKAVDFVYTNPEHYVALRGSRKLQALATVNGRTGDQIVDRFGGVLFSRAGSPVQDLAGVRGRRVAAVGKFSLGGFLLADDTLRHAGINLGSADVAELRFIGLPHARVVEQVLAGAADVGIVRTGVLEALVQAGQLKWDDIQVLAPRPPGAFPQRVSTDLAPEWPWAALPHVAPQVVAQVRAALLALPADGDAAIQGQHAGFSAPANYAPVEDLMRRLHTYPDDPHASLAEQARLLWLDHETELSVALAALLLAGLGLSGSLWSSNRHLRQLTALYAGAQQRLQMTAAAFDSQVGLIITDKQTKVLRANQAFTGILGFSEVELRGQPTALLRGLSLPKDGAGSIWRYLQQHGRWQGEVPCRHRDGHEVPCMVTITAMREVEAGVEGYVGSFVDMSQHHIDQTAIRQLAFFDVLTGLPIRRRFLDDLQHALDRTDASGVHGALIFIDLDHFKLLNDSHGHSMGDDLLRVISSRLRHVLGSEGLVARLGGDEFVVMQPGLDGTSEQALAQALALAQRLRDAILQPCQLQTSPQAGQPVSVVSHSCSGSLGLTLFDRQDTECTEVMRRADVAMYQAKHAGRNTIRHYDPDLSRLLGERAALAADLSRALELDQVVLHYQVQVDRSGRAVAAECLLRWLHPTRGPVSPATFIPLAEDSGMIIALGDWVMDRACRTLARWAQMPAAAHLELAVNVSPRQFAEAGFVDKLEMALARSGARPQQLVLEVTEGILLENADEVAELMIKLCRLGVSFAIDDFGTGYSSLSYLQRLPLRQLKIDRAFIRDMDVNRNSEAIVGAVIGLGQSLGLTVVAEGVEAEQQKALLVAMGCGLLQGFHLGMPSTLPVFEAALPQAVAC
jgi:diguanylate cyclase (GGDEF)-like protein/PAS domain S-box-containing protein